MSRESIIKDLAEDYIRRMRNWSRADSGEGIYASSSIYDPAGHIRGETVIPTLIGEASDTHLALQAVPARERNAVMLFWQYEGRALEWMGRRLGNIHYETVERRVIKGHTLHQAEIRRMTERHHAQVRANQLATAKASEYVHAC
jgi:hypothetical protein